MTENPPPRSRKRVLDLQASGSNLESLESVIKALGSSTRLEILRFLSTHTCSLSEIAVALNLPQSTANLHVNILEKSGLIKTNLQPATRGVQRVCARMYDQVIIQIPADTAVEEDIVQLCMPIGAYVDASVIPTCGLASSTGIIGQLDDPATFFDPDRVQAQLLWFHRGYVEYRFPSRLPPGALLDSFELSFEVCSEAPLHHDEWPSDISVWINGVELGTWTSPADFGGERGLLTPSWWDQRNSQFGLLKVWKVTAHGSYVDGVRLSPVNLEAIRVQSERVITVRIGIKDDAGHTGGMNLFGSKFGNYPQDIVLTERFQRMPDKDGLEPILVTR